MRSTAAAVAWARPYGSIYKVNLALAMFELRKGPTVDGRTTLGLYNTKSNVRAPLAPIALSVSHEDDGQVSYERLDHLPAELTKPLRLADRIYSVLVGQHLSLKEIATFIDSDEDTVRITMKRARGRFNQLSSGAWEALPNAS